MLLSRIIPAGFVSVLALGGGTAALAEDNGQETNHELSAVTNAKTSLSQAIAAAEQETGGKAVGAGLENQDGSMAYEIEIAKGSLQEVLVDLDSGKVIKVMAASAGDDEADEQNEAGEDEEESKHESD